MDRYAEKYLAWKEMHPDPDYQYDEINEFFADLSRGELLELMENYITLKQTNMYELKENALTIFKNEKKSETHPDWKGQINVEGKLFDIALWEKDGKKGKFFSGKISEPYKKDPQPEGSKHYSPDYSEDQKVKDSQEQMEDGLPF